MHHVPIPDTMLQEIQKVLPASVTPDEFILAAVREKLSVDERRNQFYVLSESARRAMAERGLTQSANSRRNLNPADKHDLANLWHTCLLSMPTLCFLPCLAARPASCFSPANLRSIRPNTHFSRWRSTCRRWPRNSVSGSRILFREYQFLPIVACQPDKYELHLVEANRMIGGRDLKDVPILALALALECPLWTEDHDFDGLPGVTVRRTADLLRALPRG